MPRRRLEDHPFPPLDTFCLLAALVLFAFTWVDVRYGGHPVMTQTGFQAIAGGGTEGAEIDRSSNLMDDQAAVRDTALEDTGMSVLSLLVLLLILGGLTLAVLRLTIDLELPILPAHLAGGALALLILQMVLGFPVEAFFDGAYGALLNKSAAEFGTDVSSLTSAIQLEARFAPWLWIELLALTVPIAVTIHLAARGGR